MKIISISIIAQAYSHIYTSFGPFIRIFVWIVSLLLVRPSNFDNSIQFITKFMILFRKKTSHIKWHL